MQVSAALNVHFAGVNKSAGAWPDLARRGGYRACPRRLGLHVHIAAGRPLSTRRLHRLLDRGADCISSEHLVPLQLPKIVDGGAGVAVDGILASGDPAANGN